MTLQMNNFDHTASLARTGDDHNTGLRPGTPFAENSQHQDQHKSTKHSFPLHSKPLHRRRNSQFSSRRENQQRRSPDHRDSFDHSPSPTTLSWRKRIKHVTWAWFTFSMATGGIANVIHNVPFRFRGLNALGLVFMLFNIVLYIAIWGMILARFILYPHTFRGSFAHPTESLFVPAFAVALGTILITITEYGTDYVGPWLNQVLVVMFWIDSTVSFILSIIIYLILWSTNSYTMARMTPIWIFPAYPLLICGPFASNLSAALTDTHQAVQVIVGGFTIQGVGFLVSMTIYSAYIYRLMSWKLPPESLRPGMFVAIGPASFTASGTIGMAASLPSAIARLPGDMFMDMPGVLAAQILKLVANWMSLWLWGFAIWFFFISLLSNIVCFRRDHHMPFSMTWFSFVFPQTALTTATFRVAQAFDVQAIRLIGCVMAVLVVIVWLFVVGMMIKAIVTKQILWPEKGEDKTEGGFKMDKEKDILLSAMNGEAGSLETR